MSTPHRDLCLTCALAPTCSNRGTPARPVNACDSLQAYADLCTTCNHSATCRNRGTSLRPVFYCEEFDAYVPVAADSAPWTPTRETPRNYRGVGLCADCGNRETCAVPKPEGGIWTCEVYR
jgi:hypothetical protein